MCINPIDIFPLKKLGILILLLAITQGCGSVNYSFTGTTIDPTIYKTIFINNFYNNSGSGPANLSQKFTERMKDYFQNNSSLKLTNSNGDLQFEGSITGYTVSPVAPTGDQGTQVQASLNRLTISVQVKYINTKDETQNFESSFSAYEDFPQNRTLTQVENDLIPTISDRIVLDVFNRSLANW